MRRSRPRDADNSRSPGEGRNRAIHIQEDNVGSLDALGIGRLLASAVQSEKPDLLLTGLQSDDLGYGQTGVIVAELLDWPHATIIMDMEAQGTSMRVKRELENGWFQHVSMRLPAVLAIQSGISKLRYASLMGIKKAKTKEVKVLRISDLNVSIAPVIGLDRVAMPEKIKQTQMLQGSAKDIAAQLVEKLKFEVRVI